jgi:hypothetical protein
VPAIFVALGQYRPDTHLAMITSNLDLVQIGFYALMRSLDGPLPPRQVLAAEWCLSMAAMTDATEAAVPNYRSHVEAGLYHTIVGSDDYYGFEDSASGVPISEWNRAMIKPGNRNWQTIDVGAPF